MTTTRRPTVALLTVLLVLATAQSVLAPAAAAQAYVPISGSGSTWSGNAIDQWRRNVQSLYGITINYDGSGSTTGRNNFRNGQGDFAVSEIEYGLTDGGRPDLPPTNRDFAYMPIVAGGTAFMYNLKIGNTRVTNLRLSGEVITKIFSRQITNWSDPAIAADNPGLTLPARPIVPVVRSDGSGSTAQFTRWMAARHGAIWDSYCGRPNCGFTSNFPVVPGVEAKDKSSGVAGFTAQDSSEGAITYVEYSYAKNARFPVAKVLNDAGYFVEPTAPAVAVALTEATIRQPELTQELSRVYTNGDRRSYPLSSYSYMILPTDERENFTQVKGKTLSDFAYYFLCEGQQQADALGYSPLPINLVREAIKQVAEIPGSTNKLTVDDVSTCNNPTFTPDGTNRLATEAPQPQECDRQGPTQCTTGTGGAQAPTPVSPGAGGGATTNGGAGAGGAGGGSPGAGGDRAAGGAAATAVDPATGQPVDAAIDPATGLPVGAAVDPETGQPLIDPETGQPLGAGAGPVSNVSAIPVQVALPDDGQRALLAVLAVVLLVGLVVGPPLVSRRLDRQRGASS